jgi:two-component system, NtrC family, sensor kinase
MPVPSAPKRPARAVLNRRNVPDGSAELRFICDLGRSLLFTVHPKKVAMKVADAVRDKAEAAVCVFVAELENVGMVMCGFDERGELEAEHFSKVKFENWIDLLPPQIGSVEERDEEFLLCGLGHKVEYVSPIHINGEIRGALVVGFAEKSELTQIRCTMINAAAQMAAMSVNLSAHYEAAIDRSINRAKEEHRKFTEAVLDALPVSLYVVDREYNIVTWNRHREIGSQGIPRDAALGRNVFKVLSRYPEGRVRREFERVFANGQIERIEQQTADENGANQHWLVSKIPMKDLETGEVTHVITVGEDITVRVEATQAIGKAEKLAAVGRLAAGVVHEINNPLATIAACAEALEQRVEEGDFEGCESAPDLSEYLELIKSEAFRCKSITTGLLDFSRARTGERHPIDVGDVLRSSVNLVSHQNRGGGVKFELEIGDDLPMVDADGGQIQQAVIALSTNAVDAMPDGGTLTLRARPESNSVAIEIEDTGVGIQAEDLSKIFDPFFTTKEIGKGTGLGLAVCYGIITDHGGRLSVRSNPGKGSVFTILLPTSR